jgi:hypothetical protein
MQTQYIRNTLYQDQAPLYHIGSYLKKSTDHNNQVSERFLSMVFKNISMKEVIAIQGIIHNYNPFNEKLEETTFTLIDIPSLKPGTLFGETVFFKVQKEAMIFKVELKRITYKGFETQNLDLSTYETIENSDQIDYFEKKTWVLHQINKDFDYLTDLKISNNHYQCVCGEINLLTNEKCNQCQISKEKYQEIFEDSSTNSIIEECINRTLFELFSKSEINLDTNENEIYDFVKNNGLKKTLELVYEEKEKINQLDSYIKNEITKKRNLEHELNELTSKIIRINESINQEIETNKNNVKNKYFITRTTLLEEKKEVIENEFPNIEFSKNSLEYFFLDSFFSSNEEHFSIFLNRLSQEIDDFDHEDSKPRNHKIIDMIIKYKNLTFFIPEQYRDDKWKYMNAINTNLNSLNKSWVNDIKTIDKIKVDFEKYKNNGWKFNDAFLGAIFIRINRIDFSNVNKIIFFENKKKYDKLKNQYHLFDIFNFFRVFLLSVIFVVISIVIVGGIIYLIGGGE